MLALVAVRPVSAQVTEADLIQWGYASYFGTGRYELGDGSETYVISPKPGWEWRDSSLGDDGVRRLGFRFRLPFSIGVHHFSSEQVRDNVELSNVSTLSVVPGVEIEIPVTRRLQLKPVAYLGWGTRLDGSASSWIYWLGMKSQVAFKTGDTEWMLVNSLIRIGYSPDSAPSGSSLPLMTGFDFRRPLANKRLGDDPVYLNWHVSYTHYIDPLTLDLGDGSRSRLFEIDRAWELGFGFSKGDRKMRLWRFRIDRVELAYRFNTNGEFRGIKLVFKSLFDR